MTPPPPPDPSVESELARRIAGGDVAARDRLAMGERWAAERAAATARRHGAAVSREDLEGDAMVAILEAAGGYREQDGPFRPIAVRAADAAVRAATRRERAASGLADAIRTRQERFRATVGAARAGDDRLTVAMATALTEPEREAIRRRYGLDGEPGEHDRALAAAAERKLREAIEG